MSFNDLSFKYDDFDSKWINISCRNKNELFDSSWFLEFVDCFFIIWVFSWLLIYELFFVREKEVNF